jgi:hypothetical protein
MADERRTFSSIESAKAYFAAKKNPSPVLSYKGDAKSVAYAEFIAKQNWDWFVTLTTRHALSLPAARRQADRFFKRLCDVSLPCEKKFFWAAEPFDLKDGYHLHGLLKTEAPFGTIIDVYQVTSGAKRQHSWAGVELRKYDPQKGAAMYCAKYIQKRMCDYDILFN